MFLAKRGFRGSRQHKGKVQTCSASVVDISQEEHQKMCHKVRWRSVATNVYEHLASQTILVLGTVCAKHV